MGFPMIHTFSNRVFLVVFFDARFLDAPLGPEPPPGSIASFPDVSSSGRGAEGSLKPCRQFGQVTSRPRSSSGASKTALQCGQEDSTGPLFKVIFPREARDPASAWAFPPLAPKPPVRPLFCLVMLCWVSTAACSEADRDRRLQPDRVIRAPRPRANGSPSTYSRFLLPVTVENGLDTILKIIVKVRIDITVINSRQGITTINDGINSPAIGIRAA